jgi:hypothetical protein
MLIRHAEKPAGSRRGVDAKGNQAKTSLTVRGWQRAGALACLLAGPREFRLALASPNFIFAPKPPEPHGSRRSLQTVSPLAKRLGIKINSNFPKHAVAEMLEHAISQEGVVLICWQREYLHIIANLILGNDFTAPQKWDKDRFDLVWVFKKGLTNAGYEFRQVPQNLLKGDLDTPIL